MKWISLLPVQVAVNDGCFHLPSPAVNGVVTVSANGKRKKSGAGRHMTALFVRMKKRVYESLLPRVSGLLLGLPPLQALGKTVPTFEKTEEAVSK